MAGETVQMNNWVLFKLKKYFISSSNTVKILTKMISAKNLELEILYIGKINNLLSSIS